MADRSTITVRPAAERDLETLVRMRVALWPEGSAEEHRDELRRFFAGELFQTGEVLLAEARVGGDEPVTPVGFAELSLRPCAEGCLTSPVAYLEGWWVDPDWRQRGVGAALVSAAEAWSRAQGCTEFASDTEPDNRTSIDAHQALGFEDAGLVRCFRKTL